MTRRAGEQLRVFGRHVEEIRGLPKRMSYKQMRALEHQLIKKFGRRGIDPGGKLDNVYRGIDRRKLKNYKHELIWADNLIEELGL